MLRDLGTVHDTTMICGDNAVVARWPPLNPEAKPASGTSAPPSSS